MAVINIIQSELVASAMLYFIYSCFSFCTDRRRRPAACIPADPTADVEGHDVQAKIALLAKLAFGQDVALDKVPCAGISNLSSVDFACAKVSQCLGGWGWGGESIGVTTSLSSLFHCKRYVLPQLYFVGLLEVSFCLFYGSRGGNTQQTRGSGRAVEHGCFFYGLCGLYDCV